MFWKIFLLAVFAVVTIGIGLWCRRRAVNVGEFVLGGRNVGPWLTAFAYGTSYFSAVVFVGYAGQFGWDFGVSAAWIGLGNALIGSLLAWAVLGRRTRVMTNHLGSVTMPDFFEKRYGSHALKILASAVIFIFLIPYSASVYRGLSGLFAMSFNVDFNYVIIAMAALTAVYVVAGGYLATAINDLIQGIIMIAGIILVIAAILNSQGGLSEALSKLSQIENPGEPGVSGAFVSIFGPRPLDLLWVLILTSVGTWGLPQMVHKFYAIKSDKAIKTGMVISTVFALIIAGGSYFMGGFTRLFNDGSVAIDQRVPAMLGSALPDVLIGVVLLLVLSASMSTLSSLVLASSSTFVLDFIGGIMPGKLSKKAQTLTIRLMCVLFVVLSVIIAIRPTSLITSLMSLSWGALAGAFLGPFLYGLFWRGATKASVFASIIVGVGIVSWNLFFPFGSPLMAGAVSILSSFITVPLVSLFTPKRGKSEIEDIFVCYN